MEKAGQNGILIPGDLQQHDHCAQVVRRTVTKLGGLTILVNNAAFHIESRDFREAPPEQIARTFRTNIVSSFWMAQEAVKHMKAGDVII